MAAVNFRLRKPTNPDGSQKTEPVSIQVWYYHSGVEVELATGIKVLPSQWNGNRVTGHPKANRINKVLSELESSLFNVHIDHRNKSKSEHEAIVRALIKGEAKPVEPQEQYGQKKTSLFTVGRFLAQCKRELDQSTVKRYRVLWGALARFMKGERLDFSKMDMGFHDGFKNFLYDTPNPNYKGYTLQYDPKEEVYNVVLGKGNPIGLLDEVVFKYITQLKTVCDWVAERGYPVNTSYKTWEIIKREYPPISLDKTELQNIEDLPALGIHTVTKQREKGRVSKYNINLDKVRDILIIACRSGQRISDIKRFDAIQLAGEVWKFVQRKGNRTKIKTIEIPLRGFSSMVKLILEKYNYILPKLSEIEINIGIKEVCKRAGITQPIYIERWAGNKKLRIHGTKNEFISTHTGKKTFITLLAAEGVPIKIISDLTGTSIKTIERHYLGKADINTVTAYLEKAGANKTAMRIAN